MEGEQYSSNIESSDRLPSNGREETLNSTESDTQLRVVPVNSPDGTGPDPFPCEMNRGRTSEPVCEGSLGNSESEICVIEKAGEYRDNLPDWTSSNVDEKQKDTNPKNEESPIFPTNIWNYESNSPIIVEDEEHKKKDKISKDVLTLIDKILEENEPPPVKGEFTATKRGLVGLSPLSFRLNTLERVKRDSELRRVYRGKHEKKYEFVPHAPKKVGMAIGTIYLKEHSCGKNDDKTRKKWLGKVGFNEKKRYGSHEFTKIGDTKNDIVVQDERGYNLSVILEYSANCLYRLFGDGYFETPKNRLSRLPFIDNFTKNSFEAQFIAKKYGLKNSLRIMSKWCEDYRNFESVKVKAPNDKVIPFMDFLRLFRTIPENVIEPESGTEVKLKGMLALLAASTSIGDPDCIGVTGKNCGYVVDRNEKNEIISFNVVKVDPGFAFTYDYVRGKKYCRFVDPRDIRYCTNEYTGIEWSKLTQNQKNEFLEVKIHHFEIIKSREILEFIFLRDGIFNEEDTTKMIPRVAENLIDELIEHISEEMKVYEVDITEYLRVREDFLCSTAKIDEEFGDYDRSLCKYEKLFGVQMVKKRKCEDVSDFDEIREVLEKIADVFLDVSWIEQLRGYYDRSLFFAKKAKQILLKVPDAEMSRTYCTLGTANLSVGNYKLAIKFLENALESYLRSLPENHSDIATCYNNLGIVYSGRGEFNRAVVNHENALKIRLKSLPDDHPDIAASFNNLGTVNSGKGEYSKAIENYEKALKIRLKSLPENHPDIATSYHNLGTVNSEKGEFSRAIENYEKGLKIRLKSLPENHPDIATSYDNLGEVNRHKGEFNSAFENFEKALKIRLKSLPENHPDIATSYHNLGTVNSEKGEYSRAIENFEKGLKIRLKSLPENHPAIATSYDNLGIVYDEKGEYDRARKNYEKSMKIRLKSLPENHPDLAGSYNNLGIVFYEKGEFNSAIENHKKALKIQLKSLPENHPDISMSYHNLALVYMDKGDVSTALKYNMSCLEILKKSLPENHVDFGLSYANIGEVYLKKKNFSRAEEYFKKALDVYAKSLPDNHLHCTRLYRNFGFVNYEQGNYQQAVDYFEKSYKIYVGLRGKEDKLSVEVFKKLQESKKMALKKLEQKS